MNGYPPSDSSIQARQSKRVDAAGEPDPGCGTVFEPTMGGRRRPNDWATGGFSAEQYPRALERGGRESTWQTGAARPTNGR
jgi:hypothetical protein